ncbi:MAG: ribonuclease P protein component [Promethearchaeota archaeon]
MLNKNRRINKALFKKIFKKGRRFQSLNLSLAALYVPGIKSAFAFVVPERAVKKAVARNKLKRRARAIIYKNQPLLQEEIASVFFFKKGAEKLSFQILEKEMVRLLERAGILKSKT